MLLIPSSPIGITLRNLSKPSSHDPRVIEGAAFKDSLSSWTICLLSIPVQRIFGTTCPPPPTKHTISESKRVQSKGLLWQSQAIFWWSLTSHFMRVYTWNCGATISIRTFSWSRVWPFIQELQSSKCGKACPTLPSSMAITVNVHGCPLNYEVIAKTFASATVCSTNFAWIQWTGVVESPYKHHIKDCFPAGATTGPVRTISFLRLILHNIPRSCRNRGSNWEDCSRKSWKYMGERRWIPSARCIHYLDCSSSRPPKLRPPKSSDPYLLTRCV